jgi:ubiquinone/menaquinone biosynthesis C-methylase UbiE
LVIAGVKRAHRPFRSMRNPPPWNVRAGKYARLAATLSVPEDSRLLDLGCGTGRSLVGLADGLPPGTDVVRLDVFDDRVILGNGPRPAARHARIAGLDPVIVAGDGARLPFTADSMDAVTACRVLHDLPRAEAEAALAECHRVLSPEGHLGILELPLPHDADAAPDDYWRAQFSAAGFTVESAGTPGVDDGYRRYIATPDRSN